MICRYCSENAVRAVTMRSGDVPPGWAEAKPGVRDASRVIVVAACQTHLDLLLPGSPVTLLTEATPPKPFDAVVLKSVDAPD